MPWRSTAQESFTDHLTRQEAGQGQVTVMQDAEIEKLVNGNSKAVMNTSGTGVGTRVKPIGIKTQDPDSLAMRDSTMLDPTQMAIRRVRVNGFRIQLFAGGNNRQSRAEAMRVAAQVRSIFADVPVYTNFVSPRWVCRVGDCRTSEEARELMEQLTQTGQFPEATIVKTKIYVYP